MTPRASSSPSTALVVSFWSNTNSFGSAPVRSRHRGDRPQGVAHDLPGPGRQLPQAPGRRRAGDAVGLSRRAPPAVVRGLGREAPTIIITNDFESTPKQLIERYARRMTIEQRLAESIRSFHLDALSSAVALNVDLDTTAHRCCPAGLRLAAPTPPRLRDGHPRHRLAALRLHQRQRQPRPRRGRRSPRRAHVLARAARRRAAHRERPLVGRTPPPVRAAARQAKVGLNFAVRESELTARRRRHQR